MIIFTFQKLTQVQILASEAVTLKETARLADGYWYITSCSYWIWQTPNQTVDFTSHFKLVIIIIPRLTSAELLEPVMTERNRGMPATESWQNNTMGARQYLWSELQNPVFLHKLPNVD